MVFGISIAVTKVPLVNQCAEIQIIAFGFGISLLIFRKPCTKIFSSMAFIGEPCPRNRTGIFCVVRKLSEMLERSLRFIVKCIKYDVQSILIEFLFLADLVD